MPEVRLLRIAIAVTCMVPIIAGGMGVLLGPAMFGINTATGAADSHYRYLSGLLFGIGILFLTTVSRIETSTARFRLLAIIGERAKVVLCDTRASERTVRKSPDP